MHRQVPNASISITVLLLYIGVLCAAAVAVLLIRWWLRVRDPRGLLKRSYSYRLAVRFHNRRERLRHMAKKQQDKRRP